MAPPLDLDHLTDWRGTPLAVDSYVVYRTASRTLEGRVLAFTPGDPHTGVGVLVQPVRGSYIAVGCAPSADDLRGSTPRGVATAPGHCSRSSGNRSGTDGRRLTTLTCTFVSYAYGLQSRLPGFDSRRRL